MKTIIHVNQHIIKKNSKTGEREPVLTSKTYKSNTYCHEAIIDGPCRIIYRPNKPLSLKALQEGHIDPDKSRLNIWEEYTNLGNL